MLISRLWRRQTMAMDGLQKAERKSPSLFSGELLLRGGCALMGCLLLLMGVFRIAWPRGGSPKAEMPSESKHRDRSSPVLPPSYRKGPLVLTSYCPLHTPANRSFQATASQLSAMATWTSWHGYELRPLTHDIDLDAPQGMSKWSAVHKALGKGRPWLLWIDGDAIVPDLSFSIEDDILSLRTGGNQTVGEACDVVADGFPDKFFDEADFHDGWNAGVLLFRDTPWTREFTRNILKRVYEDYNGTLHEAAEACSHSYCKESPGLLSDQLLVGYMIYEMDAHEVNNHVCLLGDPWQLQIWWQTRLKMIKSLEAEGVGNIPWGALSVHFSGCKFCNNRRTSENVDMQERALAVLRNASESVLSAHAAQLAAYAS